MKRSVVVSSLGLLGSIGFLGYTTSVAHRQEQQIQALRQQSSQLQSELSRARREHEAVTREVQEAERQLASIPTPATPAGAEIAAERRTEMAKWLKRVKRLKQLFDERPDQRVPEMKYLTDKDWLKVAKRVDLEAENGERKACAAIRDAAAQHFTPQLSAALRKFASSSGNDVPPPSMSVFAAFLEPSADPEMLDRYEIIKTTESYEKAQRWRVQTKAAIDADYDSRYYVDAYVDGRGHGGGSLGAPWAWIPDFRAQSDRAHRAFTAANKNASATGLADVLPYFNPPLSPALIEKLIKAEREQKR